MSARIALSRRRTVRELQLEPMERSDLDQVNAIEMDVYPFPWTIGNFHDSLAAGYAAWVAREPGGLLSGNATLLGYFLLMPAVDEAHLLNVSVARLAQGRGIGLALLDKACEIAADHHTQSMVLEVRPSNVRAIAIYQRYGFRQIGVRRGYYPADPEDPGAREDALVYRYVL